MSGVAHLRSEDDPNAVTTRGLSKRYGAETALDNVDLQVPEGAVYVLIGTNGAGKSTALKVLLNLERPDSGTAQVFGLDATKRASEVRAQIGYVPERHDSGYVWMTCGRLLEHFSRYYPSWDHQYADYLVRAFELRLTRKVGGLSKGEARRLQLVLALAHRPPLLLLDEPTDGLDPLVRRRTLELLTEHLADTATTVLISTHQIYELESLADHVGVLHHGKLLAEMPRHELQRTVRSYRLEVPDGWTPPPTLSLAGSARKRAGREIQLTIVGDEPAVTEQLTFSGASVRDVSSLSLEDAALAFLPAERPR